MNLHLIRNFDYSFLRPRGGEDHHPFRDHARVTGGLRPPPTNSPTDFHSIFMRVSCRGDAPPFSYKRDVFVIFRDVTVVMESVQLLCVHKIYMQQREARPAPRVLLLLSSH